MPEPDILALRAKRRELDEDRARLLRKIAGRTAKLAGLDADLSASHSRGDSAELDRLGRERQREADAQTSGWNEAYRLGERSRDIFDGLERFGDPCKMPSQTPLLLLPVRVETRFADGPRLRVRIYPDAIHLDGLDRRLLAGEREAAEAFWRSAWDASEADYLTAWELLVRIVGPKRAGWTARAMHPTNLDRRGGGGRNGRDAAPSFPDRAEGAGEGPVARLLPDRFVVVAVQNGVESRASGRSIAPTIRVGLFNNPAEELLQANGVPVTAATKWIADYDAALDAGLAVTLDLAGPGPVDMLFVYGVRRSLDASGTAEELARLLESRDLTGELGFAAQGTATNNTEQGRSGWQGGSKPRPPLRDPPPVPAEESNAAVLATALGLHPALFGSAPGSELKEGALARATNVLLWRASWGTFLDMLPSFGDDGPPITDSSREEARRLHRDAVWGRGPLPAIRVGDQPYGVLPVGATDTEWSAGGFEGQLIGLLRQVRDHWRRALPHVDKIDPAESGAFTPTMLDLLGTEAVSIGVGAREAVHGSGAWMFQDIKGGIDSDDEAENLIRGLAWEVFGRYNRTNPGVVLATRLKPIRLPLAADSDAAYLAALRDGDRGTAPETMLQALAALGWTRLHESSARASGGGRIADMIAQGTLIAEPERTAFTTFVQTLKNCSGGEIEFEVDRLAGKIQPDASIVRTQPLLAYRQSYGELFTTVTTEAARKGFADLGLHDWLTVSAELADFNEALATLSGPNGTTEDRRILVGETLDLASHRLDAWITGLVERRRRDQREAEPTGLAVGAFAWLENIQPAPPAQATKPGYIHAPSIGQAISAGVLRSSYQTHDGERTGAFAVDLSSPRVRDALDLIGGMRQGQELSALIGYRIERALHIQNLDRFVLVLRSLAPLVQGKLTDRGEALPQDMREAVAIANVVDGIALKEDWADPARRAKFVAALQAGPRNNPYATRWTPPNGGELERIGGIIESAAASLDAVADVLLAESVHQLVQGNFSRASAAINAASTGDATAPLPQVVETPVGGAVVGHRLLILAADGPGWSPTRPRAMADPRLEAWSAARLGDCTEIVVYVGEDGALHSFAETGLCALDLVYGATEPLSLARRLRAALGLAPDAALAVEADPAWGGASQALGAAMAAARAVRGVLAAAKPLTGEDLSVEPEPTRAIGADSLAEAAGRARVAAEQMAAQVEELDQAIAGGNGEAMARAVDALFDFGLAAPAGGANKDVAALVRSAALQRLERAQKLLDGTPDAKGIASAAQALFGEGFAILAAVDPPAAGSDAWSDAFGNPPANAKPAEIRRWLADYGSVRTRLGEFAQLATLLDVLDRAPDLRVVQLSTAGYRRPAGWVGADRFEEPAPDCAVASFVLDINGDYHPDGPTFGLLVEQFNDHLPPSAFRTSGIAFNMAASSSRPLQTMLLAVPSDGNDWSSEKLQEVLRDTAELAKLRAVRLEHTAFAGQVLPALYVQSHSLQGEEVLDFSELVTAEVAINPSLHYLTEVK